MIEYQGLINISYSDKPYCIYTITSTDKTDLSIYIGATSNYIDRAKKHANYGNKLKYNNKPLYKWMYDTIKIKRLKVIFEVIEKDYTEDEAFEREIEIIKYYKTLNYNVLNVAEGGKGPKGGTWNKGKWVSPQTREKLRVSHLGLPAGMKGKNHSEETKQLISLKNKERVERNWINPRKKQVYKYDKEGTLITVYSCLKEASEYERCSLSAVGLWCRNIYKPRNEFVWSYNSIN